ncbi:Uncharacterized protein TCM_006304 [Theobroma cacao]|uniref:Uncharacterized protein n=1 Tax=Theobroma cacao TaxID=3641 RepID=A0A061E4Q4_THECC|nr:Uncharacterized protein TCM_006304 [Theobroma cacao]
MASSFPTNKGVSKAMTCGKSTTLLLKASAHLVPPVLCTLFPLGFYLFFFFIDFLMLLALTKVAAFGPHLMMLPFSYQP